MKESVPIHIRHLVSEGIRPASLTSGATSFRLDTGNIFMVQPSTPETTTPTEQLPDEHAIEAASVGSPIKRQTTREGVATFFDHYNQKRAEDPDAKIFVGDDGKPWSTAQLVAEYIAFGKKIKEMYGSGNFGDAEDIWPKATRYSSDITDELTRRVGDDAVKDLFKRTANPQDQQNREHPTPGTPRINDARTIDVSLYSSDPKTKKYAEQFNALKDADLLTGERIDEIVKGLLNEGGDMELGIELMKEITPYKDKDDQNQAQDREKSRDPKKMMDSLRTKMESMSLEDKRKEMREGDLGKYIKALLKETDMPEPLIDSRLKNLRGENDADYDKSVRAIMAEAYRRHKTATEGSAYGKVPSDIQSLAYDIMDKSAPEWQLEGAYQLVDVDGNIQKGNFLRWLRTQALVWDGFTPDDKISFFSEIKTPTTPRQYSFQDMVTTDSFFIDNKTGLVMEAFKAQCLQEIWLLNDARNWDVEYKRAMGEEDKTAQVLSGLFYTSTFTKTAYGTTTLETILKMSKDQDYHKDEQGRLDPKTGKIIGEDKGDQLIGKGVRRALAAYNYLGDVKMLRDVLGDDAALFKKNYKTYDPKPGESGGRKVLIYQEDTKTSDSALKSKGGNKGWKDEWYKPDGTLDFDNAKTVKEFGEYIDVFRSAKPDPRLVSEVRDRISDSIRGKINQDSADKMQKDPSIKEFKPLDLLDSNYAENWAFKMSRWTGIAAKGSYDAWSKFQGTQRYRIGQQQEDRKGFYGNPFNINSFKAVSANVLTGISDTEGRSILEIIQGGQGEDVNGLEDDIKPFFFGVNSMQKFADDHMIRAQKIFDFIINNNEMDFHKFVSTDPIRGVVFDPAKAREVLDGISKQIRYAYGTWDQLKLGKVVRGEVMELNHDTGKYERVVKSITTAERMFGGAILDEYKLGTSEDPAECARERQRAISGMSDTERAFYEKNPDVNINREKLQKDYGNEIFWHNVVRELIAREVQSHTDKDSPYAPYTFAEREHIFHFLEHDYLGKEQSDKVRKIANAPFWKVFLQALGLEVLGGLAEGMKEGGEDVLKELGSA